MASTADATPLVPFLQAQEPGNAPAPSHFEAHCHPRMKEIATDVDDYFLQHWPFKNDKARQKYLNAGFSRVTCLYFPEALNDRIGYACQLLTVLFLIDDQLEYMSFEEGSAYNEKLIPIARGIVKPDRSVPVEYIMYDLWESMRATDKELADEILEPIFTFMRAQTDSTRPHLKTLGPYLQYREKDVGKALLSALMRYSMALHITPDEIESTKDVELNCSRHISVVNDIYSFDKEVITSKTAHKEGGALCSAVEVVAGETNTSTDASKRILWQMCREWELIHDQLEAKRTASRESSPREDVMKYIKGLEYQMSGNEQWSKTTKRYIGVKDEAKKDGD